MRIRPETAVDDALVTVEPGQVAQTLLTVRNTGDEIAEYDVQVVPDCVAAPWTDVEPATFRLMPGRDQQVAVRFRPPLDSSTPAGSFPYGVQVIPKESRHQAPVVAEGDVAVGAVHALDVTLRPPQSRGRWRGRHTVLLRNQGTDDVRVKLGVGDEDEALSFALAPTTVAVPPRSTAEAFLRVRPQSPRIFGKPSDHPFAVTYRRRTDGRVGVVGAAGVPSDGEVAVDVAATFTQKPWISKLMLVLFALLVAGIALLLIMRPWEEPEPRRPPDPLAGVTMISHDPGAVVLSWEATPDVTEVEVREVECGTAADVLPAAVGEATAVETTGSGRQNYTLDELPEGEPERCFQLRALAGDEASIWAPRPAGRVRLGQTLPPPADVEAEHTGDCAVDVSWGALAPEGGEVVYQVAVDGQPQGDPVPTANLVLEDQAPGETVEVTVEALAGELLSGPSEAVEVEVPDPCVGTAGDEGSGDEDGAGGEDGAAGGGAPGAGDEGDAAGTGDGDGDGGPGGSGGGAEGILTLDERWWLLILPPAESLDDQDFNLWVTQWQALGVSEVGLTPPPQPALGTVGRDVALPDDLGGDAADSGGSVIPDGTEILYVDLYGDAASDGDQARAHCAALNRAAVDVEFHLFTPPCRLVHPDGTVEDVAPAPA